MCPPKMSFTNSPDFKREGRNSILNELQKFNELAEVYYKNLHPQTQSTTTVCNKTLFVLQDHSS